MHAWVDVINTNLIGTLNAIHVALPHLGEGASIIATGSTAALMDVATERQSRRRPGRRGLPAFEAAAVAVRPQPRDRTRAAGHPGQCRPPDELQHRRCCRASRCTSPSGPDLEHPTQADAEPVFYVQQAMKVPWVEPEDISNMVLFLASDEARYITGTQQRVDAGGYLKWYDYHI